MLFLATSDTHLLAAHVQKMKDAAITEGAAALLHAGDHLEESEFGRIPRVKQIEGHQTVYREISKTIPIITCSGNHDFKSGEGKEKAEWLDEIGSNFHGDLTHTVISKDGISVVISTIPYLYPSALDVASEGLARKEETNSDFWFILAHEPPKDSKPASGGGSMTMRRLVRQFQPDVFLCGHLHWSPYRKDGAPYAFEGQTMVINPGRRQDALPNTVRIFLSAGNPPRARWTKCGV